MRPRIFIVAGAATLLIGVSAESRAGGVATRGAALYERCAGCHSLDHHRTGPKHCGLLGRRAGSLTDFAYSSAMRASGIVWSEKTLDRFLAAPLEAVPGTSMGYAGVDDPSQRADLIAYLASANRSRALCPETVAR